MLSVLKARETGRGREVSFRFPSTFLLPSSLYFSAPSACTLVPTSQFLPPPSSPSLRWKFSFNSHHKKEEFLFYFYVPVQWTGGIARHGRRWRVLKAEKAFFFIFPLPLWKEGRFRCLLSRKPSSYMANVTENIGFRKRRHENFGTKNIKYSRNETWTQRDVKLQMAVTICALKFKKEKKNTRYTTRKFSLFSNKSFEPETEVTPPHRSAFFSWI